MASKMTLGGDVDFHQIAKKTPGFVGADLSSLTKEAAVVAINRIFTRLRATSPPPSVSVSSIPPSTAVAVRTSSTGLPISKPHEALGNGSGSGAAGGEAAAVAPAPGATAKESSPMAAAANEPSTSAGEGGVTNGCGGAGAGEGAEAVGGFLAGPLSAAQLAPLSVTMEDFLMAVKKVRYEMCDFLVAQGFLGCCGTKLLFVLIIVWPDVHEIKSNCRFALKSVCLRFVVRSIFTPSSRLGGLKQLFAFGMVQ